MAGSYPEMIGKVAKKSPAKSGTAKQSLTPTSYCKNNLYFKKHR